MERHYSVYFITILILLTFGMISGYNQSPEEESKKDVLPFAYDQSTIQVAKPWSSEVFKNDPDEFQFAIIGDRTGGANADGTFAMAMGQLNLLQPEFVINVGDLIEGYSENREELNEMWDEADSLIRILDMPFFRTIGNHDVSTPMTKEVWLERFGADYYLFIYQDVLFMVLNSEEDSRPSPPEEIREGIKIYN